MGQDCQNDDGKERERVKKPVEYNRGETENRLCTKKPAKGDFGFGRLERREIDVSQKFLSEVQRRTGSELSILAPTIED
jgi:hypothetical protein